MFTNTHLSIIHGLSGKVYAVSLGPVKYVVTDSQPFGRTHKFDISHKFDILAKLEVKMLPE